MAFLSGAAWSDLLTGISGTGHPPAGASHPAAASVSASATDILPGGLAQLSLFLKAGEGLAGAAAGLLGSGELAAQASALDGSAFVHLNYDTAAPGPAPDVTAWTLGLTAGAGWQDAAAQFTGELALLFRPDGSVDAAFHGSPEPFAPPAHVLDTGSLIG
jgi:hypothetical protein